jgi:tRNA(fMet)-specific endonuclease VapC
MPRYMLDTDICIYISREKPPGMLRRFAGLGSGDAVISVITAGELFLGVEKRDTARHRSALERFLTAVAIQPIGPEVAMHYGSIRADLERRGETIGGNDLWIAAHARALDLALVSNNRREFERVRGLKVETWT